jgi:hypothetical protein
MPKVDQGEIRRRYSVKCGVPMCDYEKHVEEGTKKDARSRLYMSGWSHRKRLGWTCPHHDEKTVQYLNRDGRRDL